jgi:signal transduction histidine kinase
VSYSPSGSSVEIVVEQEPPGRQRMTVRDHGPGLGEGEEERVFQRFQQGRPSPYVKQTGFGLGLYIVRSYAEMLAGSVTAANHPDGGAVLTCTFPDWDGERGGKT